MPIRKLNRRKAHGFSSEMADNGARILDETYILNRFLKPLAGGYGHAMGLEDDVAFLSGKEGERWIVSSDTMIEGVHYLSHMKPCDIAWRLLATSFSDLAASGAIAKAYMLNLTLVPISISEEWLEDFFRGLQEFSQSYDVHLLGGDTTMVSSNRMQVLSATVFGVVEGQMDEDMPSGLPVRSGANRGDSIYVTGSIGRSALGLKMLMEKSASRLLHPPGQKKLIACYDRPQPRLQAGKVLAKVASAMMDISDGLLLDTKRLLAASELGGVIDLRLLPLSQEVEMCCKRKVITRKELASAGDDYELLFTVGKEAEAQIPSLAKECELDLTKIGEVREGEGLSIIDDDGEEKKSLEAGGYIHKPVG